jgi:hypothetical protein
MKLGEAFPSKYIKAADLGGRKVTVTIDSAEMANIGDEQDKLVIYFEGKSKGMVLNVTNANMIAEIAGSDETDDWKGVKIVLYSTRVDFQGRRVDAIRVDYPAGAPKAPALTGNGNKPATPSASAPAFRDDAPPPGDDDVPF